ncbi:Ger(x)C family spore germination protein [Ornithinibacillus halophilus]|uniref:Spore germination protein n=1 Tax=Ornithinibacillus halophilus TaxID=930117 RepID=A0A1M5HXD3_9BACI|nr:Ger(x)C family spore germination protein [Ornithinibacillus halophilus]SHG20539.1 spore germination protein [Ornithinibacillus halophilus]
MNYRMILVFILSSLFLTSCLSSQEIERLGVINTRGIDITDQGEIELSLVIFQFEAQSQNFTKVVSGKGSTIKGAVVNAGLETNFILAPGKIQLDLFGKETAEKGILPYLDTAKRDANIPDTMLLAVSNTPAKDMINIQEQNISMNIGQFLHDLIQENGTGQKFPNVSLQDFITTFYDDGQDPLLPIIDLQDNKPFIAGIGVFKEDKLVGELPNGDLLYINLMEGNIKDRWLEISLSMEPFKEFLKNEPKDEEELHLAFNIIKGDSKSKLKEKKSLKYETEVMMDVNLFEISAEIPLDNEEVRKKLEEEVNKKIQSDYERIFSTLQELNADPFDYGVLYRIKKKDGKLTTEEWSEIYPDIKVDFKIKTNIIRHGITN